ncbi:hypothetical protein BpHYR1_032055 [Brachionus plicatilis]|uniref:Uncharacterized protein n=1 Tax=Brachionus plicatilis TaxID=10195 RepID=A0A3M7RW77_BRAPC|nr:hypothetical protein BpHYR1_032055 [Brachionus plicatilis]
MNLKRRFLLFLSNCPGLCFSTPMNRSTLYEANVSVSSLVMSKTNTHQDFEKTTPGVIDPEESENKIRFVLSELILKILLNV